MEAPTGASARRLEIGQHARGAICDAGVRRKAAAERDPFAQLRIGEMYLRGKGVPLDYAKTPSWFQKAADQGYMYAQAELGFIYENGWGVSQDYVQAHMWFNLAAAREDMAVMCTLAAKERDKVAAIMTPDQIAEAQRLAREWMQSHPSRR